MICDFKRLIRTYFGLSTAKKVNLEVKEDEHAFIEFPETTWNGIYTQDERSGEEFYVVKGGRLAKDAYSPFRWRLSEWDRGIDIKPVEVTDSGNFYFWDEEKNLIQTVRLEVSYGEQNQNQE